MISHNFCCHSTLFSQNWKQASPGSHERNRIILNWYPSHTEIFSKRRKIYTVWVKDLSMQHQIPILTPTFQTLPKVFEQHPTLGWACFQRASWKWPLFWKEPRPPKRLHLDPIFAWQVKPLCPRTGTCKTKSRVNPTVLPSVIGEAY